MRPPIDPNPFATLYASPRDNAAGSCGYRGAMARGERAEIAHARANERPAHLPGFLEAWEEGFTSEPWEPAR